jgi:hypothetical protein
MGDASHQTFPKTDNSFEQWTRALAALREADARFTPVRAAFDQAERAYFRLRNSEASSQHSTEELAAAYAEIGLDRAAELERAHGDALYQAARTFFETPAPHLSALIEKVELIETIGYDGNAETLILADLRRLVRGQA